MNPKIVSDDETKQEISVVENEPRQLPLALGSIDLEEDAAQSNQNITYADTSLPYLNLLESLSPQVNKKKENYINGAEPGLILNSVTQELSNNLIVVPCFYEKSKVEWISRTAGGGYVKDHNFDTPLAKECKLSDKGDLVLPNGNHLVDTAYFYVLVIKPHGLEYAVISMSKSRWRSARNWNTLISNKSIEKRDGTRTRAPMFLYTYQLAPRAMDKNNNQWHIWSIMDNHQIDIKTEQGATLYLSAKAFSLAAANGQVRRSVPDQEPILDSALGENDVY